MKISMKINAVLGHCTLRYFQQFLKLAKQQIIIKQQGININGKYQTS